VLQRESKTTYSNTVNTVLVFKNLVAVLFHSKWKMPCGTIDLLWNDKGKGKVFIISLVFFWYQY